MKERAADSVCSRLHSFLISLFHSFEIAKRLNPPLYRVMVRYS
jgi:hypothetical protein